MANLVTGAEVGRLAEISRSAVSLARKEGRLHADSSGKYDLDDPRVKDFIARKYTDQRAGGRTLKRRTKLRHAAREAEEAAAEGEYDPRADIPAGMIPLEDLEDAELSDFERRLLPRVLLRTDPDDENRIDDHDPLSVDFGLEAEALRNGRARVGQIPRIAALKLASDLHRLTRNIPAEIDGPALTAAIDKAFARWAQDILHEDFDAIRAEYSNSERST